jgi:hypothetical protein
MEAIITLVATLISVSPPSYVYDDIVNVAVNNCPNKRYEDINMTVVNDLIAVEDEYFTRYNIPEKLRGMILAAACSESGFNPMARGDFKTVRGHRYPRAIGILQLWPWWSNSRRGYGILRTDHRASARVWFAHIIKQLPRVRQRCHHRTAVRQFVAAWVHAIRAPRRGGRCRELPRHYRLLRRWQRMAEHTGCGC